MAGYEDRKKAQDHLNSLERVKEKEQHELKMHLTNSKKVAVSIPPIYKKRLGSNLPLTLGLETITIPVNGKTYMVPEGFAEILQKHLHQINLEELRSQGEWAGEKGDVSAIGPIPGR